MRKFPSFYEFVLWVVICVLLAWVALKFFDNMIGFSARINSEKRIITYK